MAMSSFGARQKKLPKSVRPEEWDLLINKVPSKDKIARLSFLLAYGSGLRVSEVARCRREHFRTNSSIFIPESKYGIERVVPSPKGWRENFNSLLPISKEETELSLKSAIRKLQRRFTKYKKKAGINPKYTFHSLRHGFATRCVENGMSINQVSLALGHADIKTTSIYLRASPVDLLKSYEEKF